MNFLKIQNHNHEILRQVTELEKEAILYLMEPQKFNALIEKIEEMQKQYIEYKSR